MPKILFEIMNIPLLLTEEGGQYIAYTPALDLSTAGDTIEDAQRNFVEAVQLFFEECVQRGTLGAVLESCGWAKGAQPTPHYEPPRPPLLTTTAVSVPVPA